MISVTHGKNTLTLTKEGNIKLTISGEDKRIYRAYFYEMEDSSGNKTGKSFYDSPILYNGWVCSETLDYNSDKYPNKIHISIVGEVGWFADFRYDKNLNKFYRINHIKNKEILNDVRPPIIITGAPGGGTSYIARLLKHRGLFLGTDSGSTNLRKPQESRSFLSIANGLCFRKGKVLLLQKTENEIKLIKEIINRELNFYTLLVKRHLEYNFETFWGDSPKDTIWGWKSPSNSIFLPIWYNIFPKSKLMVIIRNKERISKDMIDFDGNWFRDEASDIVLYHYLKPDISKFSKDDVFYCDFNEIVTDIDSMNEMLNWVGLPILNSKDEFIKFLKDTGYEGDIDEF